MRIDREMKNCFRSLLLHRLRTLLSTLGILFGVVAVITMLSIGEGAKQETLEQIEQLGMNNLIVRQSILSEEQRAQAFEQKSKGLTWQDAEALRKNIPFLIREAPLQVIEVTVTGALAQISPEILAVTRHFGEIKELQLLEGRFLCDLDQNNNKLVCVLGYEIAKSLGQEGHIGFSLRLGNRYYEIVGILKSTNWKSSKNQTITTRNLDKMIFIPLDIASILGREMFSSSSTTLTEMILQIRDPRYLKTAAQLVEKILGSLHGHYDDYQVIIPHELIQQAYRTQKTFNLVLGSLATISLFVGGIGIMNIMLATVSERTREIGIRRALGANKRHILFQFLLETLILTLLGAILGIVTGISFSIAISKIAGWKMIVTAWSILLSLLMSCGVGLCSGIYPAYQASIMDPIKAVRYDYS